MVVGVCWAGTVALPHGGAISTLCAFGGWFRHCSLRVRATMVGLNEILSSESDQIHVGTAEPFADISWRSLSPKGIQVAILYILPERVIRGKILGPAICFNSFVFRERISLFLQWLYVLQVSFCVLICYILCLTKSNISRRRRIQRSRSSRSRMARHHKGKHSLVPHFRFLYSKPFVSRTPRLSSSW